MATEGSVEFGPWMLRFRDEAPRESPPYLPDFDYGTPIEFGFSVSVDLERVCSETDLDEPDLVGVFLSADCQSSDVRLSIAEQVGQEEAEVWLSIDPGRLAGSVELRRGLVMLSDRESARRAAGVAQRAGSRLLEDAPFNLVLEGSLSRFPIESASFKDSRYPARAAWFLDVMYSDPRDPFLGGVRLVVNQDHVAGKAVLEKSDSVESSLSKSALRVDVARHLFAALARDERLEELDELPEDSVVGVAGAIASNFLSMDLDTALRTYREDPIYLEQCLQNAYRYLEV